MNPSLPDLSLIGIQEWNVPSSSDKHLNTSVYRVYYNACTHLDILSGDNVSLEYVYTTQRVRQICKAHFVLMLQECRSWIPVEQLYSRRVEVEVSADWTLAAEPKSIK